MRLNKIRLLLFFVFIIFINNLNAATFINSGIEIACTIDQSVIDQNNICLDENCTILLESDYYENEQRWVIDYTYLEEANKQNINISRYYGIGSRFTTDYLYSGDKYLSSSIVNLGLGIFVDMNFLTTIILQDFFLAADKLCLEDISPLINNFAKYNSNLDKSIRYIPNTDKFNIDYYKNYTNLESTLTLDDWNAYYVKSGIIENNYQPEESSNNYKLKNIILILGLLLIIITTAIIAFRKTKK